MTTKTVEWYEHKAMSAEASREDKARRLREIEEQYRAAVEEYLAAVRDEAASRKVLALARQDEAE